MSSAMAVTDATFESDVLQADEPVLVDFWAPWCGPCRMIAPTIDELAQEYDGRVKFVKLNTDENAATAGQYGIMAIPALLLFSGGKEVNRLLGVRRKSELKRELDSVLDGAA